MADVNNSMTSLSLTFTCALTSQYINVFQRSIPESATVVLSLIYIVFVFVGTVLNLLIMAAIITTPKLQTPTFILLCNLALTDFLIGLVVGSLAVVYFVTRAVGEYDHFCTSWKVLIVLSYFLCPVSLYTITSISYDRYLSLQMKIKYRTIVTKKKACVTVVTLWVASALGTTLIGLLGKTPFLAMVCCVMFFCLIIIMDCYLLSFAAIKNHQKEIMSSTNNKKAIKKRSSQKENIRVNKGRKGIKRPVESFGMECEERKRFVTSRDFKNRDAIGQFEKYSMEEEKTYNENVSDLGLENDEGDATESQGANSQRSFFPQREESEKASQSAKRMSHLEILGGKVRHTLDPTKLKYILVKKDIRSVIEKVETEGRSVGNVEMEESLNDEANERWELKEATNQQKQQQEHPDCENSRRQTDSAKLTMKKAELLADVKKFKKTLHTILFIVVSLFLCYLPYAIVSSLVTLSVLDIGVAWDVACIIVYMNSSISPIIMCTRIANIREACRRIVKRLFRRD